LERASKGDWGGQIVVKLGTRVNDSGGGKDACGNYVLTVADCKRNVQLDFPLTSPRMRKQSLAKIDLLADVINSFREAIHAEAELIDQRKRK
jgi:hypothetical protein